MDKVHLVFQKIALIITLLIFGTITISRLFVTVEFLPFYNSVSAAFLYRFFDALSIICTPIIVILANHVEKLSLRKTFVGFCLLSIVIWVVSFYFFDFTQARADSYITYHLAKDGIDFDYNYLVQYPYQYGYILLIRFFTIFGDYTILAFEIFNLIAYLFSVCFAAKSAELICGDNKANNSFYLLQLLWIIPLVLTRYIYGFAIGLSVAHVAIYFYLKWIRDDKNYRNLALFIVLVLIASVIKQNYLLVALAAAVHQLFLKRKIVKKVIFISSILLLVMIQSQINPLLIKVVENRTVPNNIPITGWLLTGGMQEGIVSENVFDFTLPGHFNGYTALLDVESESKDEISQQVSRDISHLVDYMTDNPRHVLDYYRDKVMLTWNSSDFLSLAFAYDPSFDQSTITDAQAGLQQ